MLLCVGLAHVQAQVPLPNAPHAPLPKLKIVSTEAYRARLQSLLALVDRCAQAAEACNPAEVGDQDDQVHPGQGADFIERYGWLRTVLDDRRDPQHKRRAELLPAARARLREQLAEVDAPAVTSTLSRQQQEMRSAVLRRREFRTDQDYSLGERLSAWLSGLFSKLFGGASSLGRAVPWLGTAVQWGSLLLTASLVLLWVYRALDRQRVALGKLGGDTAAAEREAESRAWAQQAEGHAQHGRWRDAVHALYWASIVVLEDRRTLRRSGTRTPREALRLIDPASRLREPLRAQTSNFERIWYGLQPAGAQDYQAAREHYGVVLARSTGAAKA